MRTPIFMVALAYASGLALFADVDDSPRLLLLLALAYRMQERAEGGLSKAALRRLNGHGGADGEETRRPRPRVPRLRPGTRLVREWHGEVHQVMVRDKGFEYRKEQYRSLSQIARTITGTRWSGPSFFGLRRAADRQGPRE